MSEDPIESRTVNTLVKTTLESTTARPARNPCVTNNKLQVSLLYLATATIHDIYLHQMGFFADMSNLQLKVIEKLSREYCIMLCHHASTANKKLSISGTRDIPLKCYVGLG